MEFAKGNKAGFQKGNKYGGKRANAGRPPSEVREACRLAISKRVGVIEKILDNPEASERDKISAFMALAKVGVPEQLESKTDAHITVTLSAGVDQWAK